MVDAFYPVNLVNPVEAFLESLPVTLLYSKADFRPEVLKPPERMRRTLERSRWAKNWQHYLYFNGLKEKQEIVHLAVGGMLKWDFGAG